MKLEYLPGLKNHSLLILKEIFLNNIYTFTKATDQKLKSLQEKEGGVILDIGANIGIATAYFKNKYPCKTSQFLTLLDIKLSKELDRINQ